MRFIVLAAVVASFVAVEPAYAKNEGTAVPESQTANPDQKIKCRKVEVTGSMVKKGRVCKTIAEWKNIISNGNENARTLVIDGTSRPAGN